ncbi:MAG TPA: FAD-dependent oxidoreductase [Candidatus Dormibacteraeota bacterium]|nr:FAD-dependent oxidoreductase [Candidatus Dormibacteraeota bacterium]
MDPGVLLPAERQTDVLIAGGGIGGCAAAISVVEAGFKALLAEASDWIGGQFTSQAVPPDEHGWIEHFGCTRSYRAFREQVRDYYRKFYPLTPEARDECFLNPGNGWVSPLCFEPRVAVAVLESTLQPYVNRGALTILREHRPIAVEMKATTRLRAITFRSLRNGAEQTIAANYFLDATELGDVLPLANAEFVTGSESDLQTGEPHGSREMKPANSQAFSVCFAIEHIPHANHIIERPSRYEFWRSYRPATRPAWPGPLLSWRAPNPRTLEAVQYSFDPHGENGQAFSGLWAYRRILDKKQFVAGAYESDICLVNWPMNDYLLGDLLSVSADDSGRHIEGARQLSLSLLYWLQTEAPRPDGGRGWPGLRLNSGVLGSPDGLAKQPYIRESRRIKAEFTVCEQHVAATMHPLGNRAEQFTDSVGIGAYRIDLHPTVGGDNYTDVPALPFQIPLGSMIPARLDNLLPAAKNIGTTHITNGCYRLHPVEWNIGEVAGALSAYCLERNVCPRAVYKDSSLRREFQNKLVKRGVELEWPDHLSLEDGNPHRHAMVRNKGETRQ